MPEGVHGYPRWEGAMGTGPVFGTIAAMEIRRAFNNFWARLAITFVLAYTIVFLGNAYTLAQDRGAATVHTLDRFTEFLGNLRWGALAVAAVMAGPALLEDHRRGALELYHTRAVSRTDYLVGKTLAVFGVSTLALYLPALVYYASSFFLFKDQPKDWNLVPGGALVYALMWGLLVSGLGLGLSSVSRTSRGATLILLGGFAAAEVFVSQLLSGITRLKELLIISPFAAIDKQNWWLFHVQDPFSFPTWWGLAVWGALTLVGWGLLIWRHPRVRGEERAGR